MCIFLSLCVGEVTISENGNLSGPEMREGRGRQGGVLLEINSKTISLRLFVRSQA